MLLEHKDNLGNYKNIPSLQVSNPKIALELKFEVAAQPQGRLRPGLELCN